MQIRSLFLIVSATAALATAALASGGGESAGQAAPTPPTAPPTGTGAPAASPGAPTAAPPAVPEAKAPVTLGPPRRVQYPGFAVTERYDSNGALWKSVDWNGGSAKGGKNGRKPAGQAAKPKPTSAGQPPGR